MTTQLRATCPICIVNNCMRNSGDGEWICEERRKNCGLVYPNEIISDNDIEFRISIDTIEVVS